MEITLSQKDRTLLEDQKKHGEAIFQYMESKGMYNVK